MTGKTFKFGHVCSMGNLLQVIPWQPCHILAWFCSLSYTTNWALEFHAIYSFFGWHLWKLGWPLPIMCVQSISQELMVRKISWRQYSVKDNLCEGSSCKTLRLWALVPHWWLNDAALKCDCHFGRLHIALASSYWLQGLIFWKGDHYLRYPWHCSSLSLFFWPLIFEILIAHT
jgi:hypothetical protein